MPEPLLFANDPLTDTLYYLIRLREKPSPSDTESPGAVSDVANVQQLSPLHSFSLRIGSISLIQKREPASKAPPVSSYEGRGQRY